MLPSYYIDTATGRPVIMSEHNTIQLEVFNLQDETFIAPVGRLTFYGHHQGAALAFVAMHERTRLREITAALKWYGQQLGSTDLNITTIDPRPPAILKIVK